jgi:hypothetical protein
MLSRSSWLLFLLCVYLCVQAHSVYCCFRQQPCNSTVYLYLWILFQTITANSLLHFQYISATYFSYIPSPHCWTHRFIPGQRSWSDWQLSCDWRQVAEELQSGPMSVEEKELLQLLTSPHLKVNKNTQYTQRDLVLEGGAIHVSICIGSLNLSISMDTKYTNVFLMFGTLSGGKGTQLSYLSKGKDTFNRKWLK